ncbi:ALP1-like protein, partial [Tanacetum coccineum]
MVIPLFNQIVTDVSNHDAFFRTNMYCTGRQAISGLLKCTSAIHQLAYGVHANFLDEYMQITPEISFVANGVTYRCGYYLVDGIYPELATLVKTIPEPANDDHKRILNKQKQKSARNDVERAFGVLKKKWVILANPTRALKEERIINTPTWFPEEAHHPDDILRNEEQVQQVM